MGANESKPAGPQIWTASGAPSVSQDLLEQLQSNTETDSTRVQALELRVQARVTDELRRLHASELSKLREAEKIVQDTTNAIPADDALTSASVAKEISGLRSRLEARKREVEAPLPEPVERARSEVVRCLREHDRRPLDCYREVAAFKEQVRKLETSWVDKVVS